MTRNEKSIIAYKEDYDVFNTHESRSIYVNVPGGKEEHEVPISHGKSAEFLIRETYANLEDARSATPNGWAAARRFRELKMALKGDARIHYDALEADEFPTAADKTHANYRRLQQLLITKISDHTYPGDKLFRYMTQNIRYLYCKDADGRVQKPNDVHTRMQRLRGYGEYLEHNQGVPFMSDDQFKTAYWNCFPQEMKD
jgi:hypothetical protein